MIGGEIVADKVVSHVFDPLRSACTEETVLPCFRNSSPDTPPFTGHCETTSAGLVECTEKLLGIRLTLVLGRLLTHRAFLDSEGELQAEPVPLINTHIWAQYGPPGIELPKVYLYDITPDQAKVDQESGLEAVHLPSPVCGTYDELATKGVLDVVTGKRIRLDYKAGLHFPTVAALVDHCETFENNNLRRRLPLFFDNLAAFLGHSATGHYVRVAETQSS